MIPPRVIYFLLLVFLLVGCGRNAMWTTPDSCSMPLALASPATQTIEFTVRSARYGVYLVHHTPCSAIQLQHPEHVYERYNREIACDITVTIHRDWSDKAILFERHITKASLASESNDEASYDLGYFETAERAKQVMVVHNAAGQHDDSVCHAEIRVCEFLQK